MADEKEKDEVEETEEEGDDTEDEKEEEGDDTEEEETEEDDPQKERLRKERDEATEERDELDETVNKRLDEFEERLTNKQKNELVEKYAGDDETIRKAILQEFENYRPGDNSDEAIKERMAKAAKIVSLDTDNPSILDGGVTSSGGGLNRDKGVKEEGVPESTKKQGELLGIKEEDYEKYGDNDN